MKDERQLCTFEYVVGISVPIDLRTPIGSAWILIKFLEKAKSRRRYKGRKHVNYWFGKVGVLVQMMYSTFNLKLA